MISFVKTRDWLTGYDVRGRVLLAGRPAVALKTEKPGQCTLKMKFLAGLKSVLLLSRLYTQTSFLAIPALTTDTMAGSIRVGLRVTKVPSV